MDEDEIETIERPKKKRVASQKQIDHLRKIQPLATEAKAKNKQIAETVKKYEAVKKPIGEYTSIKHDISLIKEYLSKEEARKIAKREAKNVVDKDQERETQYDYNILFR